ncbi:hypothetical protein HUJ05_013012 [Dendroctonus ponderosae]|nr:hypothetical protein HUJ05_013012 [Dendroctonus ponderosae]
MALVGFIAFPRKVLLLTASYPQKDSSWSYKTRGFASLTISVLLLLTLVYNASFHIDNFVALSESLFICMSVINVLLKAIMLSVNQKTLWALVGMLETSTFTRNKVMYQSIISNFLQIVRVVDFGYFTVVFGSLLFRNLFPAFETGSLPMEFPHFNDGYFHYPFYFFQSFSLLLVALNNMALDLLVVGAVSIAAVQLQVLNSKLRDTKKNVHVLPNYSMEDEEALTIGYLKECCIYYSDIEGLGQDRFIYIFAEKSVTEPGLNGRYEVIHFYQIIKCYLRESSPTDRVISYQLNNMRLAFDNKSIEPHLTVSNCLLLVAKKRKSFDEKSIKNLTLCNARLVRD